LTNFGAFGSAERCDVVRGDFAAPGFDAVVRGALEGLLFGLLDFVGFESAIISLRFTLLKIAGYAKLYRDPN
jgi:hypothetical protein